MAIVDHFEPQQGIRAGRRFEAQTKLADGGLRQLLGCVRCDAVHARPDCVVEAVSPRPSDCMCSNRLSRMCSSFARQVIWHLVRVVPSRGRS